MFTTPCGNSIKPSSIANFLLLPSTIANEAVEKHIANSPIHIFCFTLNRVGERLSFDAEGIITQS
jgi:hypothetical protein